MVKYVKKSKPKIPIQLPSILSKKDVSWIESAMNNIKSTASRILSPVKGTLIKVGNTVKSLAIPTGVALASSVPFMLADRKYRKLSELKRQLEAKGESVDDSWWNRYTRFASNLISPESLIDTTAWVAKGLTPGFASMGIDAGTSILKGYIKASNTPGLKEMIDYAVGDAGERSWIDSAIDSANFALEQQGNKDNLLKY